MPTLWRVINSDTSLITIVYFVSLHSFINYQFHGFFDIHEDSTCIGIGGQGFATAEYEHCDVDDRDCIAGSCSRDSIQDRTKR